ncbi:MAG: hypothetical protein D6815_01325 [Candidatus Dadabacteria bacterium]|nr:MAG: hypothetical protein D6815_01325 [Candidatus Dadabacteria bacterium]
MEPTQSTWQFAVQVTLLGMGLVFVALFLLDMFLEGFKRFAARLEGSRGPSPHKPLRATMASPRQAAAPADDELLPVALAAAAAHLRRKAQAAASAPADSPWRLAGRMQVMRRLATWS